MRKPKIYSTLKVQQEMLKDTYNEKRGVEIQVMEAVLLLMTGIEYIEKDDKQ